MDPGVIGVFIPIVAIIMGIGIGMQAIWAEHKRKSQILEQNHRERMHAIEKGLELPPLPANLVGSTGTVATPPSAAKSIRNGIMLTLIGVLLFVAIMASGGKEGALFGLLPACVGIANLVYAAIQWKQEQEASGRGK